MILYEQWPSSFSFAGKTACKTAVIYGLDWCKEIAITELDGNDSGGMATYKLLNRVENPTWNPPVLEFEIERHGATVGGSVFAAAQVWRVDVQKAVADFTVNEKARAVRERDKPLKVEPLARDIETLILERREDPRLKWLSPAFGQSK